MDMLGHETEGKDFITKPLLPLGRGVEIAVIIIKPNGDCGLADDVVGMAGNDNARGSEAWSDLCYSQALRQKNLSRFLF